MLVVEKKQFPREKTCGDGLTPRAVRQLHDIGLAESLSQYLRFDGLRSIAHGVTLELAWPEHQGPVAPALLEFLHQHGRAYDAILFYTYIYAPTALGLPIVRTSPDHGTAYDIAGKGIARSISMQCALSLAVKMLARRS